MGSLPCNTSLSGRGDLLAPFWQRGGMMGFLIALSASSRCRLAAASLLAGIGLVQDPASAYAQDAPPKASDVKQFEGDAAPVAPAARERTEYMGRTIAPTMHFSG